MSPAPNTEDAASVRLVSWNVNGMRSILRKEFYPAIRQMEPDILCLQVVRAEEGEVSLDLEGFHVFWNASSAKKGYSGTAIFSRLPPLSVDRGLGSFLADTEGRVVTLEFAGAYVVNVYTPNSGSELKRLGFRVGEWDHAFRDYVRSLSLKKPVIFGGDLNVAHRAIDIARPKENEHTAGFTLEERESFDALLRAGFVDSFRVFNQEAGHYSWWNYRTRARERNVGWRIDYFCLSEPLKPKLFKASIHPDVMGSDHCPVSVEMDAALFIT